MATSEPGSERSGDNRNIRAKLGHAAMITTLATPMRALQQSMRGEDGDGNTAGESDDDGIGDVLDDGAQSENTQQDEKDASHEGGNGESLHTILLNDAIDDDDEGTRGTAYLNLTSSEERNHESCHNGSDDALLRTYTAGNTEGDGQR